MPLLMPTLIMSHFGGAGLNRMLGATKEQGLRPVTEEAAPKRRVDAALPRDNARSQRRSRSRMRLPEGAGRFWAATSSLIAYIPTGMRPSAIAK